ncbi:DUF5047 domain-containing protein [Streptomyces sp. NRRL F-5630]|uniref:DUF5047 domain-containing protein n=1 Tax=Streptomyces sp. NRRL F-5630 TaxID=1463864 RepID=UPI0004C7ADC2|nr:DUF5047 domain-containing protein [Streptomyces sp. NRRL F-5630]
MYDVSDRYLRALPYPHTSVTQVDAYFGGELTARDIPISDGGVTVDRGSKARRSLSLTVPDLSLVPWDATDPLAVYGQRLVVRRGIKFADGVEWVPLGIFRINEPSADLYEGPITLTGVTEEATISDDLFMAPVSTAGYPGAVDAITMLIRRTIPDAVIINQTSDSRNPSVATVSWDAGTDPWDAVVQVATAMRAEIYADALGSFVIRDLPDPLTSPVVWEIADGEGGTLIDMGRQMSRTAVYNAVVVSGENSASDAPPVSGVAYDNDPSSPTRWGGPFGRVPKIVTSSLVYTQGDCNSLAAYMLGDLTAPNVETSISSVPNAALEAGDCIRTGAKGRRQLHIAQSFTVPLAPTGDFPITLRGGKDDVDV